MTTYRLDKSARPVDGGRVVIGGSPLRILTLAPGGVEVVRAIVAGDPVPDVSGATVLLRRLVRGGVIHPSPSGEAALPSFAVVIPTRDRAVDHLVDAFDDAKLVIVVDDGSLVPVVADGATVLRSSESRGAAAARNYGWRAADAEIVVFVDSDCTPTPDWHRVALAHFADPDVVAVAPRVTSPPRDDVVGRYDAFRSPLDLGPDAAPVVPGSRVPYVPSAALAVRRSALVSAGGFDERLTFGEDVDLVWRLHAAGGHVRYEPEAIVEHPARRTFAGWLRQRFDYGTSAAPLAARHPGALAPLRISPWSALAWALVAAGRPRLGLGVATATTALLPRKLTMLRQPWPEALRLAGLGHLFAVRQMADALVRVWWPLSLLAALVSRRARRAVFAAATVPHLVEWARRRPPMDPLRWIAMRVLDDAAYGAGVWAGCIRERTLDPLVPRNPSFLPLRSRDAVPEHDRRREEHAAHGDRPHDDPDQ